MPPALSYTATAADTEAFLRLPEPERARVAALQNALSGLRTDGPGRMAAWAAVAEQAGLSTGSLRRLHAAWEKNGWKALVRDYKRGSSRLSPAFLQWFQSLHERCQRTRTGATAYALFLTQYKRWLEGDAAAAIPGLGDTPPAPGLAGYPAGMGYGNLMLHLKKAEAIDTLTAKRGRHKAREVLPPVRRSRAGMEPGQLYFVDDSWHNSLVIFPGQKSPSRVLELTYVDAASTARVLWGLKPRLTLDDQTHTGLVKRDMKLLTVALLRSRGYSVKGCQIPMESGTATVDSDFSARVERLTGGLVKCFACGVDRVAAWAGDYKGESKGNPRRKALLEGSYAFIQNRLSWSPGQTGSNPRHDKPEALQARLQEATNRLGVAARMDADLAVNLPIPFPFFADYEALVAEIYAEIDSRTEHSIEGWEENRWMCPEITGMTAAAFAAMPPDARAAFLAAMAQTGNLRMRRLSPREVWDRHAPGLRRLPLAAVPEILGEDFFVTRKVREDHTLAVGADVYLAQLHTPEGHPYMLTPGREYTTCQNPFEPEALHILGERGEWLGAAPAWRAVSYLDGEAQARQMATQNQILGEARDRVGFRAQDATAQRLRDSERTSAAALTQLKRLLPKEEAAKRMRTARTASAKPTAPAAPAAADIAADADVDAMLAQLQPEVAALAYNGEDDFADIFGGHHGL